MDVIKLFEENKGILNGHFLLSSGLHSNMYLQSAVILQYPEFCENIATEMIKKIHDKLGKKLNDITCIISPAIGGIVIGQEIARIFSRKYYLKVRAIFSERQEKEMTLRRCFSLTDQDKIIIVEDVITTGGTTKELITIAENASAEVLAITCIIDRSENEIKLGYPIIPLAKINVQTYLPLNCPLCKKSIPLVKPGSKK